MADTNSVTPGLATLTAAGWLVANPSRYVGGNITYVSSAQIASPTAAMLADLSATYALNVAPYTRYQSNGTSLAPLGGGGSVNAPVTLTASTSLTKALHANRTIFADSASPLVLTVDNDATTGMGSDDFFYVVPSGGGAHAFAAGTGTLALPLGAAGGSVDQPFGLTHSLAANTYVATDQAPCLPVVAVAFAATLTPDAKVPKTSTTLSGTAVTIANPTNLKGGCQGEMWLTQPASGGPCVVTWGSKYLLSSQVLSTAAGTLDIVVWSYNQVADKIDVTIKKAVA